MFTTAEKATSIKLVSYPDVDEIYIKIYIYLKNFDYFIKIFEK